MYTPKYSVNRQMSLERKAGSFGIPQRRKRNTRQLSLNPENGALIAYGPPRALPGVFFRPGLIYPSLVTYPRFTVASPGSPN